MMDRMCQRRGDEPSGLEPKLVLRDGYDHCAPNGEIVGRVRDEMRLPRNVCGFVYGVRGLARKGAMALAY